MDNFCFFFSGSVVVEDAVLDVVAIQDVVAVVALGAAMDAKGFPLFRPIKSSASA